MDIIQALKRKAKFVVSQMQIEILPVTESEVGYEGFSAFSEDLGITWYAKTEAEARRGLVQQMEGDLFMRPTALLCLYRTFKDLEQDAARKTPGNKSP